MLQAEHLFFLLWLIVEGVLIFISVNIWISYFKAKITKTFKFQWVIDVKNTKYYYHEILSWKYVSKLNNSVQSLSHVRLFVTPWTTACQAYLSITTSWSLLKFMSFESVMSSNHLILYHPLLLLPSIFPSIRVFSNKSALHIRCQSTGVSFSTSVLSSEYSGLISFRMDWLDLLAVQGILKSLLQHHRSKASILQRSAL